MRTLTVLIGFFLVCGAIVTAGPVIVTGPDWVDRTAATTGVMTVVPQSGDWVDRMGASLGPAELASVSAEPPQLAGDWIDRLIADRGADSSTTSLAQIERVLPALIAAGGTKDMAEVLSLFDSDAIVTSGGRVYKGLAEIRTYWESSGPFLAQNHWAGYTPSERVRIIKSNDRATLQFECLWFDVETSKVRGRLYANDVLIRDGERWIIKEMHTEPATQG